MLNNRLIIVAGMHRAGTSAVTGTLEGLGVRLGDSLASAQEGINDRGYKEDVNVINIHENLLWSAPSSWDSIFPITPETLDSAAISAANKGIEKVLKHYFSKDTLYAVKDPRISLFLPIWLASCERLGIEPIVVIPVRDPASVARSLHTRDAMNLARARLLWIKYYLCCEKYSRKSRRVFIGYENLLCNFDQVVRQLISDLDITVTEEMIRKARDFVSPSLNRSQNHKKKSGDETWITKSSYRLYDIMTKWRGEHDLASEFEQVSVNYMAYLESLDPIVVDQYNQAIAHAAEFREYWRDAINSKAVRAAGLFKNLRIKK